MEKFSFQQAENEAELMNNKIKFGEIASYSEAETNVEHDINKRMNRAISIIEESSTQNAEPRGWQIDSHELCHYLENYHCGQLEESDFSFLDYPECFSKASELIDKHIKDRGSEKRFCCDSRIVLPIIKYNMENIVNLDNFSFKPKSLESSEYVEIFYNGQGENEFGNKNELALSFVKAKTPRDFFQAIFDLNIKLPVRDAGTLAMIFNDLKISNDKEKINTYVAKHYSSNDRSISVEELSENLRYSEKAKKFEKGIFVDVDGTLIVDGGLDIELAEALEGVNGVVVFTGGNPEQKTEELRRLGLSERLLPVVSKDLYKGKILEKLIDDSVPDYQGFEAAIYLKPDRKQKGQGKLFNSDHISSRYSKILPANSIIFITKFTENPIFRNEISSLYKNEGVDLKRIAKIIKENIRE